MIDFKRYQALSEQKDWTAIHAFLDDVRANAVTPDELLSELYFRVGTLEDQGLYNEALDILREKGHLYKSQAHATHVTARVLIKLGREQDAYDIMSGSPTIRRWPRFRCGRWTRSFSMSSCWRKPAIRRREIA